MTKYTSTANKHGPRVLLALQNAYNKGELKKGWNPARWRSEFDRSRTGGRLRNLFGEFLETIRITNVAGSELGDGSRSVIEPNMPHVRRTLKRVDPLIVIACGKLPERAMTEAWAGDLIVVPHPAYMLLTNELLEAAGELLTNWLVCREHKWDQFTHSISKRVGFEITAAQLRGDELVRVAYRQRKGSFEVETLTKEEVEA